MANKGGAANLNLENFMKIDLEVHAMAILNKKTLPILCNKFGICCY